MHKGSTLRSAQSESGSRAEEKPRAVSSEQLLGLDGQLVIVHAGRQYRLRVTQNGKLILTA